MSEPTREELLHITDTLGPTGAFDSMVRIAKLALEALDRRAEFARLTAKVAEQEAEPDKVAADWHEASMARTELIDKLSRVRRAVLGEPEIDHLLVTNDEVVQRVTELRDRVAEQAAEIERLKAGSK